MKNMGLFIFLSGLALAAWLEPQISNDYYESLVGTTENQWQTMYHLPTTVNALLSGNH